MNTIAKTEPVTIAYNTKGAINFTVPAGVPLGRAFDDLNVLLTSALDAVESVAMNDESGEPSPLWSSVHNLQLAHALLQAAHSGYIDHRKAAEGKA